MIWSENGNGNERQRSSMEQQDRQTEKQYYDKIQYAGELTKCIDSIRLAINNRADSAGEEVSYLYTILTTEIKTKLDPHIQFFRTELNKYIKERTSWTLTICTTGGNVCGQNCLTCKRAVPAPEYYFNNVFERYLKHCNQNKTKPMPKPVTLIGKIYQNNTLLDPFEYKCEIIYYFALLELDWIIRELHRNNLLLFSSSGVPVGGNFERAADMALAKG